MLAICCYKKRKYSPKWGQVTTDIRGEIWRDKNLCNKMLHTAHTHTDRHTHDPASHFIICRVCVGARLHIQNGCKDERRLMRKKEGKKVGQECRRKQGKEKDKRGCSPLPRCLSQAFFFFPPHWLSCVKASDTQPRCKEAHTRVTSTESTLVSLRWTSDLTSVPGNRCEMLVAMPTQRLTVQAPWLDGNTRMFTLGNRKQC